jgi:hypothetical protein
MRHWWGKLLLALAAAISVPAYAASPPSTKVARLISSAATDNAAVAFDSPVTLNSILGYNVKTSTVYLKLYAETSALSTCSSASTPLVTVALPASSAFALDFGVGLKFNFGMCYRITTGSADNDTGALSSGDVLGLDFLAS